MIAETFSRPTLLEPGFRERAPLHLRVHHREVTLLRQYFGERAVSWVVERIGRSLLKLVCREVDPLLVRLERSCVRSGRVFDNFAKGHVFLGIVESAWVVEGARAVIQG